MTQVMVSQRKTMSKKQLKVALKPGTWVVIAWDDVPDTCELLIEKPDWSESGDVSLTLFDGKGINNHAVHSQVIGVKGSVVAPGAEF